MTFDLLMEICNNPKKFCDEKIDQAIAKLKREASDLEIIARQRREAFEARRNTAREEANQ